MALALVFESAEGLLCGGAGAGLGGRAIGSLLVSISSVSSLVRAGPRVWVRRQVSGGVSGAVVSGRYSCLRAS